MAQNFFSLPLFLLESSLSVYFPFVTFVTLISTWTRKNPVTFVSYWKCWKGWFIIDFPFVTFVTFVTGKKMAQIFFLLPLFLLESSLSVYFPFVMFVTLISIWTRKNPVTFVSYWKYWKGWFIIDFPLVTFVTFVTGKKMAQIFFSLPLFLLESSLSVYFPFVTFVTLISTWTRKNPVTFVSYSKYWKGWFIIDFSFVTFVTFVTGKKMAQIFFSLPLFLLESSLSVYFPFVTFVTLISTWTRKNPVTFVSYWKCWKGWFIIDFPFVTFVTFVTGKKMAQIFFSLPLFLLESSLSVYFPFVTFVTLISTWTRKNPVTFVSYWKYWKGWFIIDFPFVSFVTFVTGKKMAQIFFSLPLFLLESSLSVYFPFVTFVTLISTWTRKNPVTFVSYWKCWKGWFIIDFPFVTFVTFVTGKKMAQIFFSLPLFLLESSLSVFFPFVMFVTLFLHGPGKTLLRSFHIVNVEKDDLSLTFPSLRLLHLLRGKRWPRFFSRYLCFFWRHHSKCIFHSLRLLRWFLHGPGKTLLRLFHIENVEKDDLSLTFPSLRLLHLLRGIRWPGIFSCYLCVSSGVITLNVFSWSSDLYLVAEPLATACPIVTFVTLVTA